MNEFVTYTQPNKYKVYVTWVDHGTYVKDNNTLPALSNISMETGRNFHVTGFRLDGSGDPFKYNILIPQEIQGSFKLPQIGDIITVEENYRELGSSPVYIYSEYNDFSSNNYVSSKIPAWGSIPGDYGHLRSHADHNSQFIPEANSGFSKKYIKSVTGYRFRKYYGHVHGSQERFLEKGKFVVRGDGVFDVKKNDPLMSVEEVKTEEGMDILPTEINSLASNQADYPNPLNVPALREKNLNYAFISPVPHSLDKQIEGDVYLPSTEDINPVADERYKNVLKNKNYFSYQPIVDKKYLEYLQGFEKNQPGEDRPEPIERELPAAEEYQVSLRGNNKLLIQDQYGDGEQLLITLKNQYDAGFTIVHNAEIGQVRVRDHLGQGVLLEANPKSPRVVTWTTERQVIDMGSIRNFNSETGETESLGEYIYLRNGNVYGKSDTSFGRITETEIPRNEVPQQEFAILNSENLSNFSKLLEGISSRLSDGMASLIDDSKGSGFFFRNNPDPKKTNQYISMFNTYDENPVFTTRMRQQHLVGLNNKNIYTDFINKITNETSETTQVNSYDDGNVTSLIESYAVSSSNNSSEEKVVSYSSPAGISIYSYENVADGLESKTSHRNSVLGESEVTITTKAQVGGTSEEVKTFFDFIKNNQIEIYSNTDEPKTQIKQIESGDIVNISESNASKIISTQYIGGSPSNKIEQTTNTINIELIDPSVDINVKGRNLTLEGTSKIDIKSPAVNIIEI